MIRNLIIPSYPYLNQNSDTLNPEVQKKVLDAFEVFDHEQNKTVDAREIGTIIRSLGNVISCYIVLAIAGFKLLNSAVKLETYISLIYDRLLSYRGRDTRGSS